MYKCIYLNGLISSFFYRILTLMLTLILDLVLLRQQKMEYTASILDFFPNEMVHQCKSKNKTSTQIKG